MPKILFKNFNFKYDNLKKLTLKDITLSIEAGEKVLIAGPSGSGKSTLAHCINGLIPFTYSGQISGSIEVDGIVPYKKSIHEISEHVGTILQDTDGQFVGLSVGEDVAFSYENNNIDTQEMHKGVIEALNEVKMLDYIDETPQNLSGGQKQKISIAGILATKADILLFDEPLANLDPISASRTMETINNIHKTTNKTIIVIEHRIEDILEHDFNRVIVMSDGEIVIDSDPDTVLSTNVLPRYGLREPLYIELLHHINAKLNKKDKISNIQNTLKFKESILKNYINYINIESDKHIRNNNNIFTVQHVSYKYYDDIPFTIKDINMDIKEGEILAILGNNGAGKSTLLKVLSGVVRQQKGNIKYLDQIIDKWSIMKRGQIIGYVMQNPNHMITKDIVFDEVAFGPRNFGLDKKLVDEAVEQVLKICGIFQYRSWPISSLSYGQKKRVTIASILAMKPKLIILDEPTAGQDYKNYKEFMTFLESIKHNGTCIVMITHDINLALEYADRAVVLSNGEIIASDTVINILSNKEVLDRASLKETSISKIGRLFEVQDNSKFLEYFKEELKCGEAVE